MFKQRFHGHACYSLLELEKSDLVSQTIGQGRQFAAGGSHLFGAGGGFQGGAVDAVDVLVHLFGHRALFFRGAGDLRVHFVDGGDFAADLVQRSFGLTSLLDGLLGQLTAVAHPLGGFAGTFLQLADHASNFPSGVLGTGCQRTYFVGHHGKATTVLAGSCGLNGGVKGEQVGLLGNGGNHLDDFLNALAVRGHLLHTFGGAFQGARQVLNGGGGGADYLIAGRHFVVRVTGGGGRTGGIVGHFIDGGGHLVDGGGHLLSLAGLQADLLIVAVGCGQQLV